MAYFIYNPTAGNIIYKIAENDTDLSSLDLPQNQYTVVSATQDDFDGVRLNVKYVLPYNGSSIQVDNVGYYYTKQQLSDYIQNFITTINNYLVGHPQNIKKQQWLDYRNFLQTLNVSNIIVPPETGLIGSLELYLKNNNDPYYNILQLP